VNRTVVERNIPGLTSAVEIGSDVVSRDGKTIGTLQKLVLADSGQATHVLVEADDGTRRGVPVPWIDDVEQGSVSLGVDAAVIASIGEFGDDAAA
jgi:hypothetical protein